MKNKRIIKNNHEFQQIIGKKKTIMNTNYVLYFVKNENKELRYGISVGKKLGNAVDRNKIKRQIRMMFKDLINNYGELDYNVVVLVRKRFVYKDFSTNSQLLTSLFKELSKINK